MSVVDFPRPGLPASPRASSDYFDRISFYRQDSGDRYDSVRRLPPLGSLLFDQVRMLKMQTPRRHRRQRPCRSLPRELTSRLTGLPGLGTGAANRTAVAANRTEGRRRPAAAGRAGSRPAAGRDSEWAGS